ncbi:MAG: rhamnulokinase [Planctomycetes bacterium]|nr:rhamnulokinase [Planctomycetota bacterium]
MADTGTHQFLAIDLGAESGRGIIIKLDGGKVSIEEIHRFPNRPVRMAGTLHWDFPFLFAEVLQCLSICAHRQAPLAGISVDTWGCDFGLLGSDGRLLGNPVHYRDSRTEKIHDYSEPIMPRDEIFARTGYEPWPLSSLFQILAMQRDNWPTLKPARTFLNMPDLFNYFLTGQKFSEMSVVNTSNLMDVNCKWAKDIMRRFKLRVGMFPKMIKPARIIGPLTPAIRQQTGLGDVPVIATCGHDTSAALAAVPAEGDDWAVISCGTWSIICCLVPKPVAVKRCSELGYTNEYTIDGWYLGRNILGLWLVQELKRKWDTPGDPWDYNRMTQDAAVAQSGPLIDAADESFMAPADMEQAMMSCIEKTGQTKPASRGQLVRAVLESLSLEYNRRLDSLTELIGHKPKELYLVGGGIKNKLLCQFTADACGLKVHAGVDQCTALGNGLGQALALKILKSSAQIRKVVADSFEVVEYQPQDQQIWAEKRKAYARLTGR